MFKFKRSHSPFIFLLILALLLSCLINPLRQQINNILSLPLSAAGFITRELSALLRFHSNYVENVRLRTEVTRLKSEELSLKEVRLENERLSAMLRLKGSLPFSVIAARVISRDSSTCSSTVTIDQGLDSKIKKGMVVISLRGLVGRIVEVYGSSSKVLLLTDPRFSVSCIVQETRMPGVVSGSIAGLPVMRYIPKDVPIKEKELLITSGMTGNFPKGLIIGSVVDVGTEFGGLSLYAVVKPSVDLSSVEEVLVVTRY